MAASLTTELLKHCCMWFDLAAQPFDEDLIEMIWLFALGSMSALVKKMICELRQRASLPFSQNVMNHIITASENVLLEAQQF